MFGSLLFLFFSYILEKNVLEGGSEVTEPGYRSGKKTQMRKYYMPCVTLVETLVVGSFDGASCSFPLI